MIKLAIGKLYYSHSTTRESADFKSIPFHDASIDWNREDASTMSFKSPIKLAEADRIRYKSDTTDFGGQVYKVKKTIGEDYVYDVIDYTRLYHDKVSCSYSKMTSSQIMKKVLGLSKNNFSTAGIYKTTLKHDNLKWENKSIWDIAQQLCWLEHQAGYEVRAYVNANGTLIFKEIDEQQKGYTFTNVLDYDEEHDSTDIITAGKVTFDGKTIANATASSSLIAKWGYVTEVTDCNSKSSSSTSKSSSSDSSLKDTTQISKYNIPSKVVNQALSIAKKGNSQYDNLKLLFNWCNKNIAYVSYANSKRGAVGCLTKRGGNCCDNANLLIGMARSIGIKCRYCHALAGKQGHVYGEYYVNGKWLVVDTGTTTSKRQNKYWGGHWNGFGGTDQRYDVLTF